MSNDEQRGCMRKLVTGLSMAAVTAAISRHRHRSINLRQPPQANLSRTGMHAMLTKWASYGHVIDQDNSGAVALQGCV